MEVRDALRRRRMTRSFDGTPVDEDVLVEWCEQAARAPTAGNTRGVNAVVLAGADGVGAYLDAATDAAWRSTSPHAAGLANAGGAVVVLTDPAAYAARYGEPDKAASGLDDLAAWPVPYWHGDAAFFTMALLLLAEDAGCGACFLGAFRRRDELLALVGAPAGIEVFGAVLVGGPSDEQRRSASLDRDGPGRSARVARRRLAS